MNAEDQNQDFEKLQHLLKLKRYEQPHPRYFNDFSSQVVSRIRAGGTGARFEPVNNLISRTPWLLRFWRTIETQPAVSGGLAVLACGLMVASVFFLEKTTPPRLDFATLGEGTGAPDDSATSAALGNNLSGAPALVSSTNLGAIRSLFDTLPAIQPSFSSGTSLLQK